jgi:hypothetical protein
MIPVIVRCAVYLEVETLRVFACSVDCPGWCRSGKDEAAARRIAWHALDPAWEMDDRRAG